MIDLPKETIEMTVKTEKIIFPVCCRNLNCEYSKYIWSMKTIVLNKGTNIVRLKCDNCGAYMDETTFIIKH